MNMSYCRFQNTLQDLRDCYNAMEDGDDDLSEDEKTAKDALVKLCQKIVDRDGDGEEN